MAEWIKKKNKRTELYMLLTRHSALRTHKREGIVIYDKLDFKPKMIRQSHYIRI